MVRIAVSISGLLKSNKIQNNVYCIKYQLKRSNMSKFPPLNDASEFSIVQPFRRMFWPDELG